MVFFLSMLFLTISANLDGLAIGFSYGLKRSFLSVLNLFIISFITFLGTFISMTLGVLLINVVPSGLPNLIGSIIIIIIGVYGLFKFIIIGQSDDEPVVEKLNVKECITLGMALAINNFALGIGSSIAGFNTLITSSCSFIICFMLVYIGNRIGSCCCSKQIGKITEVIANIIMIILGTCEIFF